MAQHFLLSREYCDFSPDEVAAMNDVEALAYLEKLVWGPDGKQVCWKCGTVDFHYKRTKRKQYMCKSKGCRHVFSVTSGTPFKDHKLSHKQLLLLIAKFALSHDGKSALMIKAELKVEYKTTWVNCQKLRDALRRGAPQDQMEGPGEIDGAHISGRIRKGRRRKHRKPQNPAKYSLQHRAKVPTRFNHWHPNRRILMSLRQRGKPGQGAVRSVIEVTLTENASDCTAMALKWFKPGATIHTDEWTSYGKLKLVGFDHHVVNHQIEFSTDDGVNENQAESFFSRFRHLIWTHHRITYHYLANYGYDACYREDTRRMPCSKQLETLVNWTFPAGPSPDLRGYWQRTKWGKKTVEVLFDAEKQTPPPI